MNKIIKTYCKTHNLKIEKYINGGFVASCWVTIKAGMEIDIHNSKFISLPIRGISKKKVFRKFIYFSDGDIVDDGFNKF